MIPGAYAHIIDRRLSIVTVNAFQLRAKIFLGERGMRGEVKEILL
jgi:hypothetical protein